MMEEISDTEGTFSCNDLQACTLDPGNVPKVGSHAKLDDYVNLIISTKKKIARNGRYFQIYIML